MTCDLVPGGWRPGGAATYGALAAAALGWRVGVLTRAADDEPLVPLRHLAVCRRPSVLTTTFENVYTSAGRRQRCLARAEPLLPADVPSAWRVSACAVLLAPVLDEVDPAVLLAFPQATVVVAAQGYLRRRRRDGTIVGRRWRPARRWLRRLAAVVVSAEDLAHDPAAGDVLAEAPVLVVTDGAAGARVLAGGTATSVPAVPAQEVDPTGAGDVFAAALLVALSERQVPLQAARFAACAASFAVEAVGAAGIATRRQVEERLRQCDTSAR